MKVRFLFSTYFIVNYITFGSDKSYSNLQRSSPHIYIQLYIPPASNNVFITITFYNKH